jgi:predicted AAA+ superfamily ATPase
MPSKKYIIRDIESYGFDETLIGRHMVFLAGPRQVGKTSLAKNLLVETGCKPLYFNWDDIRVRQEYFSDSRFFESPARLTGKKSPWIVFDEIHKRPKWRDILKGVYDIFGDEFRFLITGSARLDLFRQSGDALVGRYNLFHMLPLSMRELLGFPFVTCFLSKPDPRALSGAFEKALPMAAGESLHEAFNDLLHYSPFPEPLIRQNQRFCRKWHQDYISLLVREELRDISRVAELDKIENLVTLLPHRITAPLSMANLANELEVAHTTVKSWLHQLKRLYLIFPVTPWSKKVPRGLRKEKKWYFLDWYYAPEGPARLENMAATCLYRTCRAMTDMGYGNYQLHYVRTLDKKEIDFLIVRENQPLLAVEVKQGDTTPSRPLRERRKWFAQQRTLGLQLVDRRDVLQKHPDDTWVMSIERFLSMLN